MSRERDILQWLTTDDTGTSSKTLAYRALGMRWRGEDVPVDPADLNRCLLLMERVPWVRLYLPDMAQVSPRWAALVARWDEVEKSFIEEVGLNWERARSAPRTYDLMQSILDAVPDPRVVMRFG